MVRGWSHGPPHAQGWEFGWPVVTVTSPLSLPQRTPHVDLDWYLRFSPDEPEIRLARTVQRVLACRYQPARLDLSAMAEQVREAKVLFCHFLSRNVPLKVNQPPAAPQEFQRCVQDQVGAMKSKMAAGVRHPDGRKRTQGRWSAALLDASATAHVKATQLEQVREYHRRLEAVRAFLQDLRAQRDPTHP